VHFAQGLFYFFVYFYILTKRNPSDKMAGRAQPARPEFSIIPPPAHFVKQKDQKFCTKFFPEICATFLIKTIAFFC
jgi:hypothetical protein